MWSETRANLHLELFKGGIEREDATIMHQRLEACPVRRMDPPDLGERAWELAERNGWGSTYDAEYVALAQTPSSAAGDDQRLAVQPAERRAKRGTAAARQLGRVRSRV